MVLQVLLGDHRRHVGHPVHVIWDLTGAKNLSCRKYEGRVFCFVLGLQTVYSSQNKPPSLLELFAGPEVGVTTKSDIDTGSAKTAEKHKVNAVAIFSFVFTDIHVFLYKTLSCHCLWFVCHMVCLLVLFFSQMQNVYR